MDEGRGGQFIARGREKRHKYPFARRARARGGERARRVSLEDDERRGAAVCATLSNKSVQTIVVKQLRPKGTLCIYIYKRARALSSSSPTPLYMLAPKGRSPGPISTRGSLSALLWESARERTLSIRCRSNPPQWFKLLSVSFAPDSLYNTRTVCHVYNRTTTTTTPRGIRTVIL